MARRFQDIDLRVMSETLRKAREAKGWTLEELSHALWERGFPTSQNKLWRMENRPPKRVDTELLLWLEKVLEVGLISEEDKRQVLIDDVVELVDAFLEAKREGRLPEHPPSPGLSVIHAKLAELVTES